MELKVKKIQKDAKLPLYGHSGDAGLDLFSSVDFVLAEGQVDAIPTGIKIAVPEGYVGLIWDKSGVSLKGRSPAGRSDRFGLQGGSQGGHDQFEQRTVCHRKGNEDRSNACSTYLA